MTAPGSPLDPLFLSFQRALAGRYSIDRELGRGGMGVVYLAREVHLDRLVAIKLLPPERAGDPVLREHFLREARLAAKLSHPNIIPIHAVDDAQGFVYYVMAFIDGETLAQRVRTRGPLSTAEGARVLREVAWALSHAHAQGLVHRDVKPDNILIEGGTGRVLVADFGIAAAAHDVARGGVSGTPEFMSPEQALGHAVDARSDIYSLGVTAFYALSGRLPFEGNTATEVLAKQVTKSPPRLASMKVPVARKLALLVDRCISKNPTRRPATADALAEQLGAALEQRRELPTALRAFVRHTARVNGGTTVTVWITLLAAGVTISALVNVVAGVGAVALGMLAAPVAYFVHAARRLLLQGFGHSDVGPAFAAEMEQSQDEHAVDHARDPSGLEKFLAHAARGAWAISGLSILGSLAGTDTGPLAIPAAVIGGFITVAYLGLVERRRDIDTEVWSEIWKGPIGKMAFSVARRLLGRRAPASAVTHRATELSLGMAAESLFAGLPPHVQASLGDLPGAVRQLQRDAQRLRALSEQISEALASATDAVALDSYTALVARRDQIQAQLRDAVAALENVRLNLLRLHAGSGTIDGLTTHLDLAAEVSADVGRLLAARDEVERGLSYPREVAATPV